MDGTFDNGDDIRRVPVTLPDYGSGVRFGSGSAGLGGDGVTFAGDIVVFDARGMCNAGDVYLQNDEGGAYHVEALLTGAILFRKYYIASNSWE